METQAKTVDSVFEEMILDVHKAYNLSPREASVQKLTSMTLENLKKGKHPLLNPANYKVDTLPIPNMTIRNPKTNECMGVTFAKTSSDLLDQHSVTMKYSGREFVTLDELQRMKLDKMVRTQDIIDLPLQNKYTDIQAVKGTPLQNCTNVKVVNIDSLCNNLARRNDALTDKQFAQFFPDHANQLDKFNTYSEKALKQHHINRSQYSTEYQAVTNANKVEIGGAMLPKLTEQKCKEEFARLTKTEYVPKFTAEQLKLEMIKFNKEHPGMMVEAIQQSDSITNKVMNRLVSDEMVTRAEKQRQQSTTQTQQNTDANTRQQPNQERTQTQSRSATIKR